MTNVSKSKHEKLKKEVQTFHKRIQACQQEIIKMAAKVDGTMQTLQMVEGAVVSWIEEQCPNIKGFKEWLEEDIKKREANTDTKEVSRSASEEVK